jgi:hypothetical protein
MRFKIGLAVGFAAGYWYGTTPADQRRAKIDQMWGNVRDNPRVQRVSDTVTRDAHRLGDAVEQRIVQGADGAADVIAGSRRRERAAAQGETPAQPGRRSA